MGRFDIDGLADYGFTAWVKGTTPEGQRRKATDKARWERAKQKQAQRKSSPWFIWANRLTVGIIVAAALVWLLALLA